MQENIRCFVTNQLDNNHRVVDRLGTDFNSNFESHFNRLSANLINRANKLNNLFDDTPIYDIFNLDQQYNSQPANTNQSTNRHQHNNRNNRNNRNQSNNRHQQNNRYPGFKREYFNHDMDFKDDYRRGDFVPDNMRHPDRPVNLTRAQKVAQEQQQINQMYNNQRRRADDLQPAIVNQPTHNQQQQQNRNGNENMNQQQNIRRAQSNVNVRNQQVRAGNNVRTSNNMRTNHQPRPNNVPIPQAD